MNLDNEIARKVMGYITKPGGDYLIGPGLYRSRILWMPSINIENALEVDDKIISFGWLPYTKYVSRCNKPWIHGYLKNGCWLKRRVEAIGDTRMDAICRAALKVMKQ